MTVRELANRVPGMGLPPSSSPGAPAEQAPGGSSFEEVLQERKPKIQLSKHAQQRMDQRDISLNASQQQTMSEAFEELASKGSRDALLLRSDAAFVINVPNRTVITALDRQELEHRAFTNIDSAMIL